MNASKTAPNSNVIHQFQGPFRALPNPDKPEPNWREMPNPLDPKNLLPQRAQKDSKKENRDSRLWVLCFSLRSLCPLWSALFLLFVFAATPARNASLENIVLMMQMNSALRDYIFKSNLSVAPIRGLISIDDLYPGLRFASSGSLFFRPYRGLEFGHFKYVLLC
jgi:hypothetical protein